MINLDSISDLIRFTISLRSDLIRFTISLLYKFQLVINDKNYTISLRMTISDISPYEGIFPYLLSGPESSCPELWSNLDVVSPRNLSGLFTKPFQTRTVQSAFRIDCSESSCPELWSNLDVPTTKSFRTVHETFPDSDCPKRFPD